MLTEALMLRADRPKTTTMAMRLKTAQETSLWNVSST